MALFSRKATMTTKEQALPGRAAPIQIPEKHFVNGNRTVPPFPAGLKEAIFAMGCFRGVERKFWQLPCVYSTSVGYAGGFTPNPTYEEVCTGQTGHAEVVRVIYKIMPFVFKDDVTYHVDQDGKKRRNKDRITHFSLIMLGIESKTSNDEIHSALSDYEYLLWSTITHREKDPRYRVVFFPEQPLEVSAAQSLIHRIDAHLPARNDVNKRTQNIDSVSDEVGWLMFLPKWLIGHPEKYSIVCNCECC